MQGRIKILYVKKVRSIDRYIWSIDTLRDYYRRNDAPDVYCTHYGKSNE